MTGEEEGSHDRSSSATKRNSRSPEPAQKPSSAASRKNGLDTLAEEDENEEEMAVDSDKKDENELNSAPTMRTLKKLTTLDRNKFGKFIVSYEAGKSFGEVALVKRESFRNASIIADEEVDLLVIGQDLFNRSLKADQEKEFEEINRFIDRHPYFHMMPNRLKKLLEMSLRRVTYAFDTVICRQGDPVTGLYFVLDGQANVTIEPAKHQKQYIHLWPFEAGVDIYSIEFEHLREARRLAILRKYEDPSVWETYPEEVTLRIEEGYPAIEKRMKEKYVLLCSIQKHEVIGDMEMLMNLDTHVQTITCTANTDVFILDTKNFERVVGKKNTTTLEVMKERLIGKLNTRINLKHGEQIPFLKFLYQKLTAETLPQSKPLPPLKTSKILPDQETQKQQLLQWFKEGKSTIVQPMTPGAVFYKQLMKQKAAARENLRKTTDTKQSINASLRNAKRERAARKPRSLLEIRESLRQMMEAEVIAIEQENLKKQIGSKKGQKTNTIHTSRRRRPPKARSTIEGSRSKSTSFNSLHSLPNLSVTEPKEQSNGESFLTILANRNAKEKKTEETRTPKSQTPVQEDKTQVKNVLVTEIGKKDVDLPSIIEERTQEEIILRGGGAERREFQAKKVFTGEIMPPDANTQGQSKPQITTISESNTQVPNMEDVKTLIGEEDSKSSMKLPQLNTDGTGNSAPDQSKTSLWNIPMKFVNENIEKRLMNKEADDVLPHFEDYESNDKNLSFLEDRLMSFHIRYGGKSKEGMKLPKLARFDVKEEEELRVPKPGGKVWVRKRLCRFNDEKIQVKDHRHIRHHIVPEIPQFDKVQKTKQVMQAFLSVGSNKT